MKKFKLFQTCVTGITFVFFGVLLLVTIAAYSRTSGSTGLDMAKMQKIRNETLTTERSL